MKITNALRTGVWCLALGCPQALAQPLNAENPTLSPARHAGEGTEPPAPAQPQSGDANAVSNQSASVPPAGTERQLSLSDAIEQALKAQPSVRQVRAQTQAATARVEQARSGYLPQVTGVAAYQRTTGNFATRPGAIPNTASGVVTRTSPNFNMFDYFNFSITASQLIYDFGQTSGRWSAAETAVEASQANEKATRLQTIMNVQSAFYQAWAQRALLGVAEESLTNQARHLEQIDASVKVGVRPEIDLAQARANLANAKVQLISTQNAYEIAKDQLRAAMGVVDTLPFEVADDEAPAVQSEDGPVDPLVARALAGRPDIAAYDRQFESQLQSLRALRGGYGPSLVASTTATEQGTQLNALVPNWSFGATLTWPLLQGGLTTGQIHEAQANLEVIAAQRDALRLQIRTQVDQARLAVRAAKASMGAADEALSNARQQLKLAEGRYSAGVGNAIELADAQVAYTSARAQIVQARFNLSSSRAQLATAVGLR